MGFVVAALLGILLVKPITAENPTIENHKLLLFSIDGLKWSFYENLRQMPGFKHLIENGVRAKFMTSSFPTFTSPAHMTIATGLYTESHGVVHNNYYDLQDSGKLQHDFYDSLLVNEWWDTDAEPIWITASNQGLKSGGYLFPGSNATINGKSASRSILLTKDTIRDENAWKGQIDDVMQWFTEEDLDFIAFYIEEPDVESHIYGPDSTTVLTGALSLIDRTLQYLFHSVEAHNLQNDLNMIITSDHGMLKIDTTVEKDDAISILKYIKPEWITFQLCNGPIGLVEPVPGYESIVYESLQAGSDKMDVYYRKDIPERFHFKNSKRIPSILIVAKHGYEVYDNFPGFHPHKGMHGYDNAMEDMRTMYFSIGPSFQRGMTIEGFESIHIYPLMCYLLGLEPAKNNGTLDVLYPTLLHSYGRVDL